MNCKKLQSRLAELFDLPVSPAAKTQILKHLEACEACAAEFGELQRTFNMLKPVVRFQASPGFAQRVIVGLESGLLDTRPGPVKWPTVRLGWRSAAAAGIAALLLLALSSIDWPGLFRGEPKPEGSQAAYSLLAHALAADDSVLRTAKIFHFVKKTVFPPLADSSLAGVRGEYAIAVGPDGQPVYNRLTVSSSLSDSLTFTNEAWYEPSTGRFARIVKSGDRILFAGSFDGQFIFTMPPSGDSTAVITRQRIANNFSMTDNPQQSFGLLAGHDSLLKKIDRQRYHKVGEGKLADGTPVNIIRIDGLADPNNRLRTHLLFKLRRDNNTIAESEFYMDETLLKIDRFSRDEVVQGMAIPWDLHGIDSLSAKSGPAPRVSMDQDVIKSGITPEQMFALEDIPLCLINPAPSWAADRKIFGVKKAGKLDVWYFNLAWRAADKRHVVLSQCRAFSQFDSQIGDLKNIYTSPRGFTLLTSRQGAWLANITLLASQNHLLDTPAPDCSGYLVRTPAGSYCVLAINGVVNDTELRELADKLMLEEEYLGCPLAESGIPLEKFGDKRWTALFAAVSLNREDKLKEYLAEGADPKQKNERTGLTPLMLAASRGLTPLVEDLLAAGADIDAISVDSTSAASLAIMNGHTETMKVLLARGGEARDALFAAVKSGNLEMAKMLLHTGSPVNSVGKYGFTPLIVAVNLGNTEMVRMLLGAGAEVDQLFAGGLTPLMIAAGQGHAGVLKALLAAGAKIERAAQGGRTALMLAARQNKMLTVYALLAAGANANALDDDRAGALTWAVSFGNREMLDSLLAHGAKVDLRNPYGETVLFKAAAGDNPEIIRILLQAGAEVNALATYGGTALLAAADKGNLESVRLLLDAGAEANVKDDKGNTPMSFALAGGHTEVVHLLRLAGAKE